MKRVEHKFSTQNKQSKKTGNAKQTISATQAASKENDEAGPKDAAYLEKSQANLESQRLAAEKRAGQSPVFVSEGDPLSAEHGNEESKDQSAATVNQEYNTVDYQSQIQ